jgi:hydroxymethylpyrimidine pyrophosphatase-like HAD family hydrolase
MHLRVQESAKLRRFIDTCDLRKGLLALDLDGTTLLEERGKVFISSSVEQGVKAICPLGVPIVVNTLRFPLSVMTTVGEAWYRMTDAPIRTVMLNGSLLGSIQRTGDHLEYEELAAFALSAEEINSILTGVSELLDAGIKDVLLFYYPQDWRLGEILWTPDPAKNVALQAKYVSASQVIAGPVQRLRDAISVQPVCMASLLIDRPEDSLMAYQHSKPSSFFTARGINKASGLRDLAARIDRSLIDSIAAGDTQMDTFLSEAGLAVVVGSASLPFQGKVETIQVPDPLTLGELIVEAATLASAAKPAS